MSDEGSAQPVAAPAADVNAAADNNNTVDTKVTDAPASAAAETKAEGPNPTGEKAEKEAAEPAKEDETPNQAEGKKELLAYICICTYSCACDHMLTVAST